eukprot:4381639-Amphidinium_carterae.1
MAHCFHSAQFGFLRDRYITQAIGQLEQGAMAAAASNPFAAVLFCDLRNAFGSIHRGFLRAVLIAHVMFFGAEITSHPGLCQLEFLKAALSFADDLAYLLIRLESLIERYSQMEELRAATGLTPKPSKCIILPIGSATCDQCCWCRPPRMSVYDSIMGSILRCCTLKGYRL